jgi:hypothetical protein
MPSARADTGSGPAIFVGVGGAAGYHEQIDATGGGFAPTSEPQYANFPDAFTVFNASTPSARASTYYPGATTAGLGDIICGQVIEPNFGPPSKGTPFQTVIDATCPTPPFPTVTTAPTRSGQADTSTPASQQLSGAGPASLTAVSATAHADHQSVSGDATDSGFTTTGTAGTASAVLTFRREAALALHGPVAAATVSPAASDNALAHGDSAQATSHQSFPNASSPNQLVATATSTVHGVGLLGGAIHIDSIVSTSTFQTDGQGQPKHTQSVTVSGVSVAGVAATIDQNGITVNGSGQGSAVVDALNGALQQLLTAAGTHIRLLSPSTSTKRGQVPAALSSGALGAYCTNGEADGVQLYQQADARSVPQGQIFFLSVTLASACSDATVFPASTTAGLPTVVPTGAVGTPVTPGSPGQAITGGPVGSSTLGASAPSNAPSSPAIGSPAAPSSGQGGGILQRFEGDLVGHAISRRFAMLYLAFTFGFAAVVLGAVPVMFARLPTR